MINNSWNRFCFTKIDTFQSTFTYSTQIYTSLSIYKFFIDIVFVFSLYWIEVIEYSSFYAFLGPVISRLTNCVVKGIAFIVFQVV